MTSIETSASEVAVPQHGRPWKPMAGNLLGIIGVAFSTLNAVMPLPYGHYRIYIVLWFSGASPWAGIFSSNFLLRVVTPMLIGGLLVFVGRRLSDRGFGRATAEGVMAAILPLVIVAALYAAFLVFALLRS